MSERMDPMSGEMIPTKREVRTLPDLPVTGFSNIAKAIAGVMKEITPVHKEGTHELFKFKFAKMQDLMQELTPLMGKHGLAIIPTEVEKSWVDKQYVSVRYSFTIIHESGEVWPERPEWTGMSLAITHKGGVDDKCLNKCATAARKYFLISLFNIPTADADDADRGGNEQVKAPPAPPASPKPIAGAKPHVIPISEGMDLPHWVAVYLSYIATSNTGDDLKKWDSLNDQTLNKVSNKDKEAYDKIVAATQKRAREIAPKNGPPPPPGEVEQKFDGEAWLKEFAKALNECTTVDALEEVRKTVGLVGKGKASTEEWEKGGVLLLAATNRIAMGS